MRRGFLSCTVVLLALSGRATAQTGIGTEGALDFARAIGARSVGMGETMVAAGSPIEGLWSNPALAARGGFEASFNARNNSGGVGAEADVGVAVLYPVAPVGVVGLSLRYINLGQIPAYDRNGDSTGVLVLTSKIIGATFSTTLTRRLAVGITIKELLVGSGCTGNCDPGLASAPIYVEPKTTAVDFGAQYYLKSDTTLVVGAGVRNLGSRLQFIDSPQADPLPARADFGVLVAPKIPSAPDIRLRMAGDVVARLHNATGLGLRVGAELSYLERYHARVGYVVNGDEINGATLGFGVGSGRLKVDIAQMVTDASGLGVRPTFLTLHYAF